MAHKLVAVTWDDAHIQADTLTAEEVAATTPCVMTTFGLLVRDDEAMVGVAAELKDDGSYRSVTFVPRALVREIVSLGTWPRRSRARKVDADVRDGRDAG